MINRKPRKLRKLFGPSVIAEAMINRKPGNLGNVFTPTRTGVHRSTTQEVNFGWAGKFPKFPRFPVDLGGSIMIHFISTTPTETTCPRCHAHLRTAFHAGLRVPVHAEPLAKPADDLAPQPAGHWTYTLPRHRHLA